MDYYEKINYIEMNFDEYKNIECFYRFWDKVDVKENIEECWNWKYCTDIYEYGIFRYCRISIKAHRIAYMLSKSKGPIHDGLPIQHLCNNPRCCNPNHLQLGTQSENIRYMYKCRRHPNIKFTESQVREIHKLYNEQRQLHPEWKQWQITGPIAQKFNMCEELLMERVGTIYMKK